MCEGVRRAALKGRAKAESLIAGEYPVRVPGAGLEFIGLREYTPDDDYRWIDWRASARAGLEKIYVREYSAEKRLRLVYLVDLTASMSFKRKLESLAFTLAFHARISEALRDEVALVTLAETVRTLGFESPLAAVERVLGIICGLGARGSIDLGEALTALAGLARGLPLAIYTDYANSLDSFARIVAFARASGGSVRFFVFATPSEKGAVSGAWNLPLFETETQACGLTSLRDFAESARRHVTLLRSRVPLRCLVEVPAHAATPPLRELVASYMGLRGKM